MPTVRYNGPSFYRRSPDAYSPDFTRGEVREVTQAWVDEFSRYLVTPYFTVEGSEAVHRDEGNDGIPDASWRRGAIVKRLGEQGVDLSGSYRTKTSLLAMVDSHLNPPIVEPEVIEEPVIEEEVIEEVIEEVVVEETTDNNME
jgi:hypothetical protein